MVLPHASCKKQARRWFEWVSSGAGASSESGELRIESPAPADQSAASNGVPGERSNNYEITSWASIVILWLSCDDTLRIMR